MKKARILYVHHCPLVGGASWSLLYLVQKLDRERFSPEVLFLSGRGEASDMFEAEGIPIHYLDGISVYPHTQAAWLPIWSIRPWKGVTESLRILPSAKRVEMFLRAHPVDLIHLNSLLLIPAALGAARSGIPVVWHVRESLHRGMCGVRRYLIRRLLQTIPRKVIAISRESAKHLGPRVDAEVVYNYVDFEKFDCRRSVEDARELLGVCPSGPVVLMLGGAMPNKGCEILVRAASLVRNAIPGVQFWVFGYPPQPASKSSLKRWLRTAIEVCLRISNVDREIPRDLAKGELQDTVLFMGVRRDIETALAASDVVVFPATASHFARPVIEAGAMKKPVIASDFPSTRELVVQGETGLLVPPGDVAALAQAVIRVLSDPEEASRMAKQGFRLARERYDSQNNYRQIEAIYAQILQVSA